MLVSYLRILRGDLLPCGTSVPDRFFLPPEARPTPGGRLCIGIDASYFHGRFEHFRVGGKGCRVSLVTEGSVELVVSTFCW